jgi:hypothetical protein
VTKNKLFHVYNEKTTFSIVCKYFQFIYFKNDWNLKDWSITIPKIKNWSRLEIWTPIFVFGIQGYNFFGKK